MNNENKLNRKEDFFNRSSNLVKNLNILATIVILMAAFIPRLEMSRKLDVVTDEVVYLYGGKVYLPLMKQMNFGSNQWLINYEHPSLVKLLIGLCIELNNMLGHPISELLAGRLPSVVLGTLLVVTMYRLGRAPFGDIIACIAALSLAFSPWLTYFSAIAYLDMTMATFVTIAYLLLWHATQKPWFFVFVSIFIGLGAASKYTAVLAIPGIIIYTIYYFFLLRPLIPIEQRPRLPWKWWGIAILVAPASFLCADPSIWPNPIIRLLQSFNFEAIHSEKGHPVFLNGQTLTHVPSWTILYEIFAKMSIFLTLPTVFFIIFVSTKMIIFHTRSKKPDAKANQTAKHAYLLIWLLSTLGMYSLLNIAVGSHYYLPVAPTIALAGVSGLIIIFRFIVGIIYKKSKVSEPQILVSQYKSTSNIFSLPLAIAIIVAALAIFPHLLGLSTVYAAEGYTNEFYNNNEDNRMQVAYPAYREALQWIDMQTPGHIDIGLVGSYLHGYNNNTNWFSYNSLFTKRFDLEQVDPTSINKSDKENQRNLEKMNAGSYIYLVWPKHVLQRGTIWPKNYHIVHVILGGNTTYCYILKIND